MASMMKGIYNRGTAAQPRWYCHYIDVDGKRRHRRLSTGSREEAERLFTQLKERIARGAPVPPPIEEPTSEPTEVTLSVLVQRFLKEAALRSKDPAQYRDNLRWLLSRHVLPALGPQPLSSISTVDFEALSENMLEAGYKISTMNAVVRAMSVVFSWARRRSLYAAANPMNGLQRAAPPPEMEFFSEEEIEKILSAALHCGPATHATIKTALYTGLRKGELFGLRWSDVDLERGQIFVRRSYRLAPKSGRFRTVPIHPDLSATLRSFRAQSDNSELVFPVRGRMGTPHDMCGLYEVLEAAGVRKLARPWHAMRHTFASHYVMNGGNLLALQRMLGHSRFEMTQLYSHLSTGFMAAEILRVPFGPRRGA